MNLELQVCYNLQGHSSVSAVISITKYCAFRWLTVCEFTRTHNNILCGIVYFSQYENELHDSVLYISRNKSFDSDWDHVLLEYRVSSEVHGFVGWSCSSFLWPLARHKPKTRPQTCCWCIVWCLFDTLAPTVHRPALAIVFNYQQMSRNEVMDTGYSSKKYR